MTNRKRVTGLVSVTLSSGVTCDLLGFFRSGHTKTHSNMPGQKPLRTNSRGLIREFGAEFPHTATLWPHMGISGPEFPHMATCRIVDVVRCSGVRLPEVSANFARCPSSDVWLVTLPLRKLTKCQAKK